MTREDAAAKGVRYLESGRLIVTVVTPTLIEARCRGDSGVFYELGWVRRSGFWCSCPAVRDHCAHLVALRRVTLVPGSERSSATSRVGVA